MIPQLAALAMAASAPSATPTADQLIDQFLEAAGGAKIEKIESYMSSSEMVAPMGTLTSKVYWGKPEKVYVERMMPGMGQMAMGCDGDIGWRNIPMMGGISLVKGEQLDEIQQQAIHMRLLHLDETLKDEYTYGEVTEEQFDGVSCYAMPFSDPKTPKEKATLYFERGKGLLRGMTAAETTEMGEQASTIKFTDWKPIDGAQFFHRMAISQGGMEMVVTYSQIELNKVKPSVFEFPDEVKKLMEEAPAEGGDGELSLQDFTPQTQALIQAMMENLPWENHEQLRIQREQISAGQNMPGERGQAMKYIVQQIDKRLAAE